MSVPVSRIPGEDDAPLSIEHDLEALDDAFAVARLEPSLPDGTYRAHVQRVDLTRAQASGRPLIKWTLRVLEPGSARPGRHLWRNLVLSPETLPWLRHDLELCGLRVARLSDLPNRLEELTGREIDVRVRSRKGYLDVFLIRAHPVPARAPAAS
jgi:hypothetical protein